MKLNIVYNENCLDTMKRMADSSIDSIVTDPPYGISFMNKKWDYEVPSVEIWKEVYRILKPGGHLLCFGGTRTYHRMVCNIEDAGFEIRDQIAWVFSSGFPKSLNISKQIDKMYGLDRTVIGIKENCYDGAIRNPKRHGNPASQSNIGKWGLNKTPHGLPLTLANSDDAKKWNGWGTALKPAFEPICLARKPVIGNITKNVLVHGTGGINVDGCRIGGKLLHHNYGRTSGNNSFVGKSDVPYNTPNIGRFPANFIHDGSEDVLELFPNTTSGAMKHEVESYGGESVTRMLRGKSGPSNQHGDTGSAARFFYCAKAYKTDRDEGLHQFDDNVMIITTNRGIGNTIPRCPVHNKRLPSGSTFYGCGCKCVHDSDQINRRIPYKNIHPTVKPTSLMRYLCRLITPPDGTVYDPFSGSGSTGKAAILEGFSFIGSELDSEYTEIANARMQYAVDNKDRLADQYRLEHIEKTIPKKSIDDNEYF